ncbi:MAG: VanW family protein [Clostridia bacterium]|nr:VanW family protein [Clostridia bacterium]
MESNEKKEIKEEMKTKEENETTVKEKQNEEKTKENETIEVENEDKKAEVEEKKQEEDNPEEKDALKEEIKEQYKIKSSNKKTLIILISAIILVIAIFASTGFALFNINNTKIISNISIEGIDVSKLSKKEAEQKISDALEKNIEQSISVKTNEFEYQFQLSQIEAKYDINKAIEDAYNIGRNGNIFKNNLEIVKRKIKNKNIEIAIEYNQELLENIMNEIAVKIPGAVEEPNYCIEDGKLTITKGKAGNSINKESFNKEVIKRLELENQNEPIELEIVNVEPEAIDIDKIYNEVHKEAKDAYYTKDPFQVYPHVEGVDFDLEAAREMLKEDKEEYTIDLKITMPKITTNKIGSEAFPDLLSTFSTKYDASNTPRTTNLRLAMNKLNGVVVSPGETFSYNKTLGKRTAKAGYKEAGGFAGGRVVQTLAGGICQISSTLYDAVVYANLEIVERHNHMFLAGYVGAGKDATVVYGAYDFKFKNTRKYPVMLKTSIGGGVARIDIFGIKEDVEYEVEISSKILSYTPFKVIKENDSSLAPGKERVTQNGMNGCKSITYKILKLNGKEVSRTVLSSDTYDPMNKIIKVGPSKTTEVSTQPVEEPEPTPTTPTTPTTPETPSTPSTPTTPEPGTGENTGSSTESN